MHQILTCVALYTGKITVVYGSPRAPAENGDTAVIANRHWPCIGILREEKIGSTAPCRCDMSRCRYTRHTLTPPPPFFSLSLSLRKDAERGVEARRPTNMMGRREAEIVPHVEHVPHNSKLFLMQQLAPANITLLMS